MNLQVARRITSSWHGSRESRGAQRRHLRCRHQRLREAARIATVSMLRVEGLGL